MKYDRIHIVKIGGNVIDCEEALDRFISSFKQIPDPKILVHGGGKEATRLSNALGLQTTMIDGRRVTDAETLRIVTMVYAGLINKRIVAKMQASGIDAIGLSGADANVIVATKRPAQPVDYGYVGDIDPLDVNDITLSLLLRDGFTPVLSAITHDGKGQLLNSNADTVAAMTAIAASRIAPADLTFCFERPGVLANPDDDASVIESVTENSFGRLKEENVVTKGMIPKIQNAMNALHGGVMEVYIKSADNLLSDSGTTVTLQ